MEAHTVSTRSFSCPYEDVRPAVCPDQTWKQSLKTRVDKTALLKVKTSALICCHEQRWTHIWARPAPAVEFLEFQLSSYQLKAGVLTTSGSSAAAAAPLKDVPDGLC